MLLFLIILVIAAISVGWAFLSLKNELRRTEHEKAVKKDLSKGRVIFYPEPKKTIEDSKS